MNNNITNADSVEPLEQHKLRRTSDARELILQLRSLQLASPAAIDWQRYCTIMRQLCRAAHCAVIRLMADSKNIEQLGRSSEAQDWTPFQVMPAGLDLVSKAGAQGYAFGPAKDLQGNSLMVLVFALQGLNNHFLILNLENQERNLLNELVVRGLLCVDFSKPNPPETTIKPSSELTKLLSLAADVMQQKTFAAASLTLVNGLVVAWQLKQVSIGWVVGGDVRLVAISHLDRFERSAERTRLLQKALIPCVIQGAEVWWPQEHSTLFDSKELAEVASECGASQIATVPVMDAQGVPCAGLLLAFDSAGPGRLNLEPLMIVLELVQPRLADLWRQSLNLPQQINMRARSWSQKIFGPDHTFAKVSGIFVFSLLAYAMFGTWEYRIDASAQLETDQTRVVSAQFDGRIEQASATTGDWVEADQVLVTMDTKDLSQQKKELESDIRKAESEVDKARAEGHLADADIAQARLNQALARKERIDNNLADAIGRAPFAGVIVEGETKDLLNAPVKKGDKIFRIAKVEGLYVSLKVSEKEMQHIRPDASAELILLSNPDLIIPLRMNSVIPAAQVKGQDGVQFTIKASLLDKPETWWRPGMTGLVRIEVGQKNILWILTHKLVDSLRLKLWW